MNLRNVLRAYSLLRTLSDDESALLSILRALNDNDREQLIASMSDKPQKKSSKKSAGKGVSKSQRASGMAAQLNKSLQQQRQATTNSNEDDQRCIREIGQENGLEPCGEKADANIHHLSTHPLYHEFQPAGQAVGASGD